MLSTRRKRSRSGSVLALLVAAFFLSAAAAQEIPSAEAISSQEQQAEPLEQDHHDHHHHHHNDATNSSFCHGMYMTMFTDGFRWSLNRHNTKDNTNNSTADDNTPPCLAYYVHSWKLNVSGKFRGAMVFSFLIALLTEGISASRFVMIDYLHQLMARHPSLTVITSHRKWVLTFVYTLQSLLGTMIMLVAMMYSIEMLLSVVAGLMVGNYLFMREPSNKNRTAAVGNNQPPTGGNFMAGMGVRHADVPVARRTPVDEERQGLLVAVSSSGSLVAPGDTDSIIGGLGSPGGLQMQTRKED